MFQDFGITMIFESRKHIVHVSVRDFTSHFFPVFAFQSIVHLAMVQSFVLYDPST